VYLTALGEWDGGKVACVCVCVCMCVEGGEGQQMITAIEKSTEIQEY
jgi:hypothetical protein